MMSFTHARTKGEKVIDKGIQESKDKKLPGQVAHRFQFVIYEELSKIDEERERKREQEIERETERERK